MEKPTKENAYNSINFSFSEENFSATHGKFSFGLKSAYITIFRGFNSSTSNTFTACTI